MKLREDIDEFIKSIPNNIVIVAATKYVNIDVMRELISHGIFNFGENRVDAFLEKYEALSKDKPTWHFIGHLQRNKALKVIDKIDYLHSLDSLELAKLISKNRTTPLKVFIEVSINEEENKNGVRIADIDEFVKAILPLKNIELVGLMMMSIKDSSSKSLNEQFFKLSKLKDKLESEFNINIPYLSMGMSDDYLIAIQNKATHIRLGRILFSA